MKVRGGTAQVSAPGGKQFLNGPVCKMCYARGRP